MPVHMVNVRLTVFNIRLELLTYIAARRKLIKNFSLELYKEIEYFTPLFLGKFFKSSVNMAFRNYQKMSRHKSRIAKNDVCKLPFF